MEKVQKTFPSRAINKHSRMNPLILLILSEEQRTFFHSNFCLSKIQISEREKCQLSDFYLLSCFENNPPRNEISRSLAPLHFEIFLFKEIFFLLRKQARERKKGNSVSKL